MFCNGNDAYSGDVFDKSKNKTNKLPKSSVVELRSTIQSLLGRVTQLEKNNASQYKLVQALEKSVTDLKLKNSSLKEENEKLKSSFKSHTTGYKTFCNLTNAQVKSLQGLDSTEYQMKCKKFELEISKISRLCSGIQNR